MEVRIISLDRHIVITDLTFEFENQTILQDLNLSIFKGEFICFLGRSGCGKSTLLRLIAGLEKPKCGFITYKGSKITKPSMDIAMVFQDYSLFPWMTNGENISLSIKQRSPNLSKNEINDKARDYLKKVDLENVFNKYPFELSGGMRQRCALCRSLALEPDVLLMDEPFGALDPIIRANLQDLTLSLWNNEGKDKRTIIFVTHDVDEAIKLGSRIVVLNELEKGIVFDTLIKRDDDKLVGRENLLHYLSM